MPSHNSYAMCKKCRTARSRDKGLCWPCFRSTFPHFTRPLRSRLLQDLRLVYAGRVQPDPLKATKAQVNLAKMFDETPSRFMDLLEREEKAYQAKLEAAWAASERMNAADKAGVQGLEEPVLPEEPVEQLIQELLERVKGAK